jgi:nucleotidyltransferase/DNA polymerase involved in DNA repair
MARSLFCTSPQVRRPIFSSFVIAPHQVAEFVRALPLAKIPGVGKVSAAKLENTLKQHGQIAVLHIATGTQAHIFQLRCRYLPDAGYLIASDMNKPNGQFVIAPHQVAEFVRALPLAKIPGVGPQVRRPIFSSFAADTFPTPGIFASGSARTNSAT